MKELRVTRKMTATAEEIYDSIADVTRMGEWSPENLGGEWLDGAKVASVGARFKGRNKRKGTWSTTAVVTEADRGRAFAFAVGRGAPDNPDTEWRYTIEPAIDGCEVTEICRIVIEPGVVGRVLTKLGTGVSWAERPADLERGMSQTLERLDAALQHHA